jgi:hypothetical protein
MAPVGGKSNHGRKGTGEKDATNKPCSNCKKQLPAECFSKKQLRQRNHKHLLCCQCLGRPISSAPSSSTTRARNPIKRECFECGKFLPHDRFSKTQWAKSGDCKSCVEKKQSTRTLSFCHRCRQPKACPGFSVCRGCHVQRQQCDRLDLPGGVRYLVPDFRNARAMSFQTTPIDSDNLVGTYELLYLSVDENWSRDPTLSSTARGTLVMDYSSCGESKKRIIRGSLNLEHPAFQERVRSICSFQGMERGADGNIPSHALVRGSDSFFSSHVHEFAPDTTWHDPEGDFYTQHNNNTTNNNNMAEKSVPGKLKFLRSNAALPLDVLGDERKKSSKRRIKSGGMADLSYNYVSNYWICNHLRLPEDVGRLIRKYVCPPPVLHLVPGDLLLVTMTRRKEESDWTEMIVAGRKK